MTEPLNPNKMGIMVTIAIVFIVIWITMIEPITLPVEIIGIGLSLITIVLAFVIFKYQFTISSDQSRIIKKNEKFEKSQLYYIKHNLSLESFRLLDNLKELEGIIETIQERYEKGIEDQDPLKADIDDIKYYDILVKSNLDKLTGIDIFGNMLIHEAIKEKIRKIEEMYGRGPVHLYPDYLETANIRFVIWEVEACRKMLDEDNYFK